jgi:hypothetical protein
MNSARFARCAVDCRPRSGWAVDKELTLLRIHSGFFFTIDEERKMSQRRARAKYLPHCEGVLNFSPLFLLVDTESKE